MPSLKKMAICGLLSCQLILGGCGIPLTASTTAVVAGSAAALVTMVNLAREQYPDIDFDKPAPVEALYVETFDNVWNAVNDTLMEMRESSAMMDKNSGVIRTTKRNLNDVSWIGKALGKATFEYELNLTVRQKIGGVGVSLMVPFWEQKVFIASKEKNLPEGSNMMRHIFYNNLNKRIHPESARYPDSPTQDIRYAPMTQGSQPSSFSQTQQNPQPQSQGPMDLREAQRLLNEKGFDCGTPDGKIGPRSRRAIREFQGAEDLPVTGKLDQATMDRLRKQ